MVYEFSARKVKVDLIDNYLYVVCAILEKVVCLKTDSFELLFKTNACRTVTFMK